MGKYKLFNQQIEFSDAEERLYDIYYRSIQAASNATTEFYKWYYGCGDILTVLKNYKKTASSLVVKYANQPLFEELTSLEIYDVSEDRYDDNCFSLEEVYSAFNEIAGKYDDIIAEQEAAEEYRAERKASRGRVVGGGFGVGGAIKGMATAGAMNAISGMGHSIANAIGNASSAATAASDKKALYKNDDTCIVLAKAIHLDIISCYFSHVDFINQLKDDYFVDSFDLDRAGALFDSAKKVEQKRVELLIESFVNYPWNEELLIYIFKEYKQERRNVWEIAKRFHIDLTEIAEEVFANDYASTGKTSEIAAQTVKKEILSQMKVFGIQKSETIDTIEKDGIRRILKEYDTANHILRQTIFDEIEKYDASLENKATVIHDMGVWEIASKYSVKFTEQEAEVIMAKYYNHEAQKTEAKALKAKAQIKEIMTALELVESETYNTLEKDCLRRLCGDVSTADETICNEILSKIQAYDALEKNKEESIQLVKSRIEQIWSSEDGALFDNLYMNTDIYNLNEVNKSLEYVRQNGRTANSQKYLLALSQCNDETIKKAFRYKSKYAKVIIAIGCCFAIFTAISLLLGIGFLGTVASLILSIVFFIHYNSLKKAWDVLTLDGTVMHKAFSEKRKRQKSNGSYVSKKMKFKPLVLIGGIAIILFIVAWLNFFDEQSMKKDFDEVYDAYVEASLNFDEEALMELVHESYYNRVIDSGRVDSKTDFLNVLQHYFDSYENSVTYVIETDSSAKYVAELYKIKDVDMNDTFELAKLSDTCGYIADDIQEAKRVTVNYSIMSQDGSKILYTDFHFLFIKVDGGWYLGEIPALSW